MKELVIYPGSAMPPKPGDAAMHLNGKYYFAPDSWSLSVPFSHPFDSEEEARAAADEFAARKAWF
jgi:hypothetical protein